MHIVNGIKFPFKDFFDQWSTQKNENVLLYGAESRLRALDFVKDRKVVVDIGAHVGISLLHWSAEFESVIGFEPMIDHFSCLKDNTTGKDNIEIHNYAISNFTGEINGAYRSVKNSGSFTLLSETYQQPRSLHKQRKLYKINSYKLDDLSFDRIDLLKIDVEGWEFEVLKGAVNTIKKHKPVLLVEFTGGDWKKSFLPYNVNDYYTLIDNLEYKVADKVDIDTIYVPK